MSDTIPIPNTNTLRYRALQEKDLLVNERILIAANPSEARGRIPLWKTLIETSPERVISILPLEGETKGNISLSYSNKKQVKVLVSDEAELASAIGEQPVLLDVSALPHYVWAPILKCLYSYNIPFRVLYTEPESYKPHPSPASDSLFDLSIKFEGLAPLPGFVKLFGPEDEDKCIYIALLGFEGSRPERLALQIDPQPKVIPIIGMPGFQLEYPAFAVACNRNLLQQYNAHSELRYARASCPFEVYHVLESIHQDYPEYYLYIAPVGTKPHSLGAIWYAIVNPNQTEIMFDFPIQKSDRTNGIGLIHIYDFLNAR